MSTPCGRKVAEGANLVQKEADQLIARIMLLAQEYAKERNINIHDAVKQAAGEIKQEELTRKNVNKRNALLTIQVKRRLKEFVQKPGFRTFGEGLRSFLVGTARNRDSIDAQAISLHYKYTGRLIAELDEQGLTKRFKSDENTKNIFIEMGELDRDGGQPGKTGDKEAAAIAKIISDISNELVARQNRAGAFIHKIPGYIVRQTHDIQAIRALGGFGHTHNGKQRSFEQWAAFVLPLLDTAKTFRGGNAQVILRNIHDGLYSGKHGPDTDESVINIYPVSGSLGNKVSAARVLHFKDAEASYAYNEAFGTKNFKESILTDIHHRTRSIALMENLGPNPEVTLRQAIDEIRDLARARDDAALQSDSLQDWRIMASFNEISGKNEHPANPTLNRISSNIRIMIQMAKMGSVVLSSFADRAFMQSEAAYQGIKSLNTLGAQIRSFAGLSKDKQKLLRYMGVGLDGILGNALSRYGSHTTVGGALHNAQKLFFSMNFLNLWTDVSKRAAGELFSSHLGDHATMKWDELPDDLRNALTLYDFTPLRWDALRIATESIEDKVFLVPENVKKIPMETIVALMTADGKAITDTGIAREYDRLESMLRTYLIDRTNIAIPTPGAAERVWTTMNTQAGTPLGEAVRMLTLFKSFPITIMNKVLSREIYGRGSMSFRDWLTKDTKGKWHMAQLIAMTAIAGYTSGVVRDLIRGRNPKPLIDDDNSINWTNVNDAMIRGGSLGLMGDVIMNDYDRNFKSFLSQMAGPVFGQLDTVMDIKTKATKGQTDQALSAGSRFAFDNIPMINLFYIRPILDYFILWNLEEALNPGSLNRMEQSITDRTGQSFWMSPADVAK